MGDDDYCQPEVFRRKSTNSTSTTFHFSSFSSSSKWMLPLVYGLAVLSWFSALRCNDQWSKLSTDLQAEIDTLMVQREETLDLLDGARRNKDKTLQQYQKRKSTQHLFQHEMRIKDELYEMRQDPEQRKLIERRQSGIAMTWVEQRQQALYHKIYSLQEYIQATSKQNVLDKYGPGPHKVEFSVKPDKGNKSGKFVVELASIDLVPHSVETFLNMVSEKLWDNTVFYHHLSQHHVIAAAPVNYGTFETKHYHFDALGYNGVSFPEYHSRFQHKEYTIGFSGLGPNFYINTLDNTEHHGPGGQGHHDLPNDADPCFGKIISGQKVIKDIMMPGTHSPDDDPVSWHDFDLTRIVNIRIL